MMNWRKRRKRKISTKHHVPERTCVACHQVRPKQELVRIVRSSDRVVELDIRGRKSGRGAYLCKTSECWNIVSVKNKKDRLSHVLKTNITNENREVLSIYGKNLPPA